VILGAIAALLVAVWPSARDAAYTAALIAHLARPLRAGPLHRWTGTPAHESVAIPSPGRPLAATLFRPAGTSRGAGLILVHGLNPRGKDDPLLVWVADLFARSGFVVLMPDFTGFRALAPRAGDVDEIVASARYLSERVAGGRPDNVGLVAFSFGAGPTVVAAADPGARDCVRFVVSFGGYYDLVNVINFATTGWYEYREHRGQVTPLHWLRWIFLKFNLDLLSDPLDRAILGEIASREQEPPDPRAADLTPEGRAVYALVVNRDPARVPELLKQVDSKVLDQIARLSPSRAMKDLRTTLFIAHSNPDPSIPFTESLHLAEAAADPARVHLLLVGGFRHVQPQFPPLTWSSFWNFYLDEGRRLFVWVYRLVRAGA